MESAALEILSSPTPDAPSWFTRHALELVSFLTTSISLICILS